MKKFTILLLAFYALTSTTNAQKWEALNLPSTYTSCIMPIEPGHIYTKDNRILLIQDGSSALYLSDDRAKTWEELSYPSVSNSAILDFKGNLYLSNFGGIFKSKDNGKNWIKENTPFSIVQHLTEFNNTLYAASFSKGIYKLDPATNQWNTIAFDGKEVTWIGAINGVMFARQNARLNYSKDAGVTWINTGFIVNNITGLASSGNTLMISTYPSTFATSTDNGATWKKNTTESHCATNVDDDIIGSHAISETNGLGVFKYDASTAKWADFTQGEAALKRTYALSYNKNAYLYAIVNVSNTSGKIDLKMYGIKTGKPVSTQENILSLDAVRVYPNPTEDQLTLDINQVEAQSYELSDLQGRIVSRNSIENNESNISLSGFAQGIYILKVNCKEGVSIQKVNKI